MKSGPNKDVLIFHLKEEKQIGIVPESMDLGFILNQELLESRDRFHTPSTLRITLHTNKIFRNIHKTFKNSTKIFHFLSSLGNCVYRKTIFKIIARTVGLQSIIPKSKVHQNT